MWNYGYEWWRVERTRNEYGETVEELTFKGNLRGRAYKSRMTDTFAADAIAGRITWTFATDGVQTVRVSDLIMFTDRSGMDRELTVKAVGVTSSGRRLECLCQETQGAES